MDHDPNEEDRMDELRMDDDPMAAAPMIDAAADQDDLGLEDELDELAIERELSGADELLSAQLRELLDPAAGLSERTATDIDRSLRGRSSLTAALDLLGLGWWTAKALLGDDRAVDGGPELRTLSADPEHADPEGEGT